jgi:hypothetical protein
VTQDYKRSFALFGEMETNPICIDRAMRHAADSLRADQTGWIQSRSGRRAGSGNEFTSLHG